MPDKYRASSLVLDVYNERRGGNDFIEKVDIYRLSKVDLERLLINQIRLVHKFRDLAYRRTEQLTRDGRLKPAGNQPDHIYIFGLIGSDAVKIGISHDPEDRCKSLSNGPHTQLRIILSEFVGSDVARKIERRCHIMLKARRAETGFGREWFKVSPEEAIRCVRSSIDAVNRIGA